MKIYLSSLMDSLVALAIPHTHLSSPLAQVVLPLTPLVRHRRAPLTTHFVWCARDSPMLAVDVATVACHSFSPDQLHESEENGQEKTEKTTTLI